MELRSACCGIQAPKIRLSSNQRLFSHHTVSPSLSALCDTFRSQVGFRDRRFRVQNESKEIVTSFISEVLFYMGLAMFLLVTDRVQKPYLEFSSKRWSLITGLKGYMSSAFFTTGFKVLAPLFAVFITWPVLGLPALVAVGPFLAGCLAQLAFESRLARRGSSAWPLVPIIFEVYRLYQLTKAAHFIQRLMFAMKDVPVSPDLLDRSGAMVAMLVTFQVVGAVCLWSWLTLLLRLFPSRPVVENY